MQRLAVLVVVAALAASCSTLAPTPPPTGRPVLGISNATPLAVTLFVNGQSLGTANPGVAMPPIDFGNLPPLPWSVEARSPTGRVLTMMHVDPGSVSATTVPNSGLATSGTIGRVNLSCGRITIWAGYSPPSAPVPASPAGAPGDCAP